MKFNRFMIYGMIFLAILTLGAVNAADNATADDLAFVGVNGDLDTSLQNDEIIGDISCDDTLAKDADEGISEISEDNSSDLAQNQVNELALIPVALDVNVVNNSRVDINAGNVTGNVIVIVDDSENTVALNNDGSASFPLKTLSAGNHTLVVIYEGDDTYDPAHVTSVFSIPAKAASEFGDIVIGDDFTVTMTLKDEMGNVIANVPVKYAVNGTYTNTKTNAKGILTFLGKAGAVVSVIFDGNENFAATNTTVTFNTPAVPSAKVAAHFNIPNGAITVNGYAVDTKAGEEGIYFTTKLLDANGNAVKGVPVRLVINNNIYSAVTLDDGSFTPFKVNMAKSGKYTMVLFFDGNSQYSSAFASVNFNLAKKTIKIKASAKKFKASATKKYTVKLSTIVGSSHDGKAHLSSKKVTLKIKGKTYTAKTKSNGKATFKLKITKKGKYTAKIKFAGDNTYKSKSKSVKITIK